MLVRRILLFSPIIRYLKSLGRLTSASDNHNDVQSDIVLQNYAGRHHHINLLRSAFKVAKRIRFVWNKMHNFCVQIDYNHRVNICPNQNHTQFKVMVGLNHGFLCTGLKFISR